MTTEEICSLIEKIDGMSREMIGDYISQLRSNNISGLVLSNCDLKELKAILRMKFGDWELFRCMVETLKNDGNSFLNASDEQSFKISKRNLSKDPMFGGRESTPPKSKTGYLPTIQGSLEHSREDATPGSEENVKESNVRILRLLNF